MAKAKKVLEAVVVESPVTETRKGFRTDGLYDVGYREADNVVFCGPYEWDVAEHFGQPADGKDKTFYYTLGYGWRKGIRDGIAGLAKAKRAEGASEAVIVEACNLELMDKAEAIIAGTVSTRNVGPRLVGLPRYIRDEALKAVKAACASEKLPMPTGDELDEVIEMMLDTEEVGDDIRAAAQAAFERDNSTEQKTVVSNLVAKIRAGGGHA